MSIPQEQFLQWLESNIELQVKRIVLVMQLNKVGFWQKEYAKFSCYEATYFRYCEDFGFMGRWVEFMDKTMRGFEDIGTKNE